MGAARGWGWRHWYLWRATLPHFVLLWAKWAWLVLGARASGGGGEHRPAGGGGGTLPPAAAAFGQGPGQNFLPVAIAVVAMVELAEGMKSGMAALGSKWQRRCEGQPLDVP